MSARIHTVSFAPAPGKAAEHHSTILADVSSAPFASQLADVMQGIRQCKGEIRFARFFLSDIANQEAPLREVLAKEGLEAPVSTIQQEPLDGSKIAAWLYSADSSADNPAINAQVWHAGLRCPGADALTQTDGIFREYQRQLGELTVADNCVRTWIYVQDIDNNYAGVVKGRRDYFGQIGLTHQTHYIASTGIEGKIAGSGSVVCMDALAMKDIVPSQIRYLHARSHLSPTYDYKVTFERGVAVQHPDRTHIFISGTASIDQKGQVLHIGDVAAQTGRMLENVQALLSEAGAVPEHIAMATIYLRDASDYAAVRKVVEGWLPSLNAIYVHAPVCRPTWLVEMECIAICEPCEQK